MKIFCLFCSLVCVILLPASAGALVSGGHDYADTCNANGFVLTSKHPVVRKIRQDAKTKEFAGIEKIYLGRRCDAFHPIFGKGSWCWGNGGFRVDFENFEFGFARQELNCEGEDELGLVCSC